VHLGVSSFHSVLKLCCFAWKDADWPNIGAKVGIAAPAHHVNLHTLVLVDIAVIAPGVVTDGLVVPLALVTLITHVSVAIVTIRVPQRRSD
jgi:hypothetical protein